MALDVSKEGIAFNCKVEVPWKRLEPLKLVKQRFIPEDWILAVPDDGGHFLLNVAFPTVNVLKQRQIF